MTFPSVSLCVVGNVNRDITLHGIPGTEGLLRDGETTVQGVTETVGGGGANSACAAAVLGAQVHFVGKVGADELAGKVRNALEQVGVRAWLACDPQRATGTTVALGFVSGQRHFLSCLPNNDALAFQDIDLGALDGCTHLLRADVWFSVSMLEGGNEALLREAKRRQITTSLDINFDPVWRSAPGTQIARRKEQVRRVLPLVDIAHGNIHELCQFTDSPSLDKALARLEAWGAGSVVVHMGDRGAGHYGHGALIVEPPCPARGAVHATGSGDVLSVCMILLHARQDLTIQQKLAISNRIVCEFMEGRRPMIPSL